MGNIVSVCKCSKKEEEEEEEESDSSDSQIEEIEKDIKLDTKEEIPKTATDISFTTDTLVKAYNYSPYQTYQDIELLGGGTYGVVKKVCLKNNKETVRAMKIIDKQHIEKGQEKLLFEEIEILRKLEHPNIMKIYEYFIDQKYIYIISEFLDEGDLLGKLKKLNSMSELVVKFLMSQILDAVAYLHANRVFHGDIKLENIMLYKTSRKRKKRFTTINRDLNSNRNLEKQLENNSQSNSEYIEEMSNYEIKLIDFGCSKYLTKKRHNSLSGIVGTSMYCSPEVVNNLYDEKSDEWSCGILMYILLTGDVPFEGKTEIEIFDNIKKYNINFNTGELKNVSNNCMNLLKSLLDPKKKNRITAFEALKHPFFTDKLNPMKILTQHKDLNILKKFLQLERYPSILHKVVVAYLCFNFIDIEEEKKLSELFRFLDQKNRNKLEYEDFRKGFIEANIIVSHDDLKKFMKLLDTDGSKLIEYQEFLRALCDKDMLFKDENLKAVFNVIDKDKKGYINLKDIKNFIIGIKDDNFKESDLEKLGEKLKVSNDSEITFEKFCDFIRNFKVKKEKTLRKSLFHKHENK